MKNFSEKGFAICRQTEQSPSLCSRSDSTLAPPLCNFALVDEQNLRYFLLLARFVGGEDEIDAGCGPVAVKVFAIPRKSAAVGVILPDQVARGIRHFAERVGLQSANRDDAVVAFAYRVRENLHFAVVFLAFGRRSAIGNQTVGGGEKHFAGFALDGDFVNSIGQ